MKKKLLIIAAITSFSMAAVAMPNLGGERADRMAKKLDLSDQQREQVDALMKEQHEKMRKVHEELKVKMKDILDGEQYKKWESFHEKRMEKIKSKHNSDNKR